MKLCSIIFVLAASIYSAENAKILGLFPVISRSHHISGTSLLKALAKKGHEVTVISPYPFKKPIKNYRDIHLKDAVKEEDEEFDKNLSPDQTSLEQIRFLFTYIDLQIEITELVWKLEEVQQFIKNKEHFDVVIIDYVVDDNLLALAHHLNAPTILYSGGNAVANFVDRITGNPHSYSYVPNSMFPISYSKEMTFIERSLNFVLSHYIELYLQFISEPVHQKIIDKYLPNAPRLSELHKNVSLVLINSHYSLEVPHPYLPNMVQIGGFHVSQQNSLPKDLQTFMDEAKNGVVLFSFGTNVKISTLNKDRVKILLKVLGEIAPIKVLFKSEIDLPNVPKNVKVSNWLPQNDLLAHPNMRVFISHGGYGSITESTYNGVPVLGIPIFADQIQNMADIVSSGFGIRIKFNDITEKLLKDSLNDLLTNPSYKNNIKSKSELLKNQPINPMEHAIYWVEHVIKHKRADHLRSPGRLLTWYQYHCLDVVAFLLTIISITVYIWFVTSRAILRRIARMIFGSKSKKVKTQ